MEANFNEIQPYSRNILQNGTDFKSTDSKQGSHTKNFLQQSGILANLAHALTWFFLLAYSIASTDIACYQCNSVDSRYCPETLPEHYHVPPDEGVVSAEPSDWYLGPKPCDNVFEARYCIKTTGFFGGVVRSLL